MRRALFTSFIAFAFLAPVALSAWTGPTATAPNGNVPAPVNVGSSDQVKNAGLGVNYLAVFGNILLSGVGNYLNFGSTAGTSGYGIRDNAGVLEFKNSGGTWATIQSTIYNLGGGGWTTSGNNIYNANTGNVGIGTTGPGAKLDVQTTGATNLNIAKFLQTNSGTGNRTYMFVGQSLAGGRAGVFGFTDNTDGVSGNTWITNYGDDAGAGVGLFVKKGGNVGIGTANPAQKLDVTGNAVVNGQMNAASYCIAGTNCITSWPTSFTGSYLPLSGGTMTSGATIDNGGRMHIASTENIYLLARGGNTYVSSAWGGGGNLNVDGTAKVSGGIYDGSTGLWTSQLRLSQQLGATYAVVTDSCGGLPLDTRSCGVFAGGAQSGYGAASSVVSCPDGSVMVGFDPTASVNYIIYGYSYGVTNTAYCRQILH
ncbi:MAG: hypothetical protein AAB480_00770 [Patescibacteria group bacterium]